MWTPGALSCELQEHAADAWRVVEDQRRASTMRLVDDFAEQDLLERMIEASKPPLPPECRALHYLLATPFRYRPAPHGSRFRRQGERRGVLYAAEDIETALTEIAFYRLLFLAEAPGMTPPKRPAMLTAFSFRFGPAATLDLTRPPLVRDASLWTAPADYAPCQALADAAREAGAAAIRYRSARRAEGANLAVFACAALAGPYPERYRQWLVLADRSGVSAWTEHPTRETRRFPAQAFREDRRLAALFA